MRRLVWIAFVVVGCGGTARRTAPPAVPVAHAPVAPPERQPIMSWATFRREVRERAAACWRGETTPTERRAGARATVVLRRGADGAVEASIEDDRGLGPAVSLCITSSLARLRVSAVMTGEELARLPFPPVSRLPLVFAP